MKIVTDFSDRIEDAFRLLKLLRPDLTFTDFDQILDCSSRSDSYTFVGFEDEQKELLGLIGFRILYDFLHLKHVYIDDLVVAPNARNKGVAKALLEFVEKYAYDSGCNLIRVSTGYDYSIGRNYYEKNGWDLKAVTYKRTMLLK